MKKRIALVIIIIIIAIVCAVLIFTQKPAPEKQEKKPEHTVMIGHAVCDENGDMKGGKAGDQTGEEVFTRKWYGTAWSAVIRPKSAEQAERIAKAMEDACANDNIGYDRYERITLFECAKKCGWNIAKITEPCETDCSALVAVCVNASGTEISKDVYTGNLQEALMNTGDFELLTDEKYITSKDNLKRGDILLKKGHTAVVLSNTPE